MKKKSTHCSSVCSDCFLFRLLFTGFIVIALCWPARTSGQTVSLEVKKASLESVLLSIQQQSGYSFLFKADYFDQARPVTLTVKQKPVKDVLALLFADQPFDYKVNGAIVTLVPGRKTTPLPAKGPPDNKMEITGRVTDSTGTPLKSVSVQIKGTAAGTTTDAYGRFSLQASKGAVLVFSIVGYVEREVTIENRPILDVVLSAVVADLDEIVTVAYGTQRKVSVIGAITSISPSKLKVPVTKLSSALAGQLAGVVAVQSTGEPGSGAAFWIRGVSTFGANSRPLVLVDGIERSLDLVDPEDVESFSILKDATATAVYGVRGANGIVLVTTKRGKISDKPSINLRAEQGYLSPVRMVKLANAAQWMDYYNDISFEGSSNMPYPEHVKQLYLNKTDPDLYPNVDWMDAIFKDRTTNKRLNLNITGGGKIAKYYISGSYLNENGLFEPVITPNYNPQYNYNRFNFRSNLDVNVTPSTVLNLNLSNQYERRNRLGVDMANMYTMLISTPPISTPLQYSDGSHAMPLVGFNPYYSLNSTGFTQDFWNTSQSLIGLTQDFSGIITSGLKANFKFSWDAINESTLDKRKSPATFYATGRDTDGKLILHKNTDGSDYLSLARSNRGSRAINLESSLMYDRLFAQKHRIGGLFLFNMREFTNNFPEDYIAAFPYRNIGVASRLTYSFKDKYFAEGNFGYNGSENFAPGKRFGFFPSVAAGYLVSNEAFFQELLPVISLLKFKGSYGEIGNDQIGGNRRFAYNTEMQGSTGYIFGSTGQGGRGGISTGYPGNPDVSWETAIKKNVGVELELFNRLKIQADYFNEKREGIYILQGMVPSIVGNNIKQFVNLGRMENKGIDGSLEYAHVVGEFAIQARGNFTYNRNRILYNDQPDPIWGYQSGVGKRYGQIMGLVALGLFESEEEIANSPQQMYGQVKPGDIRYKDINGDGIINSYDYIGIGYAGLPEISYGFGTSVAWKGFDVSVFFHGVGHVNRVIGGPAIVGPSQNILVEGQILSDVADKRWSLRNPDPNAAYARLSLAFNENNAQASTFYLRDMRFLRLKNTELGYSLPKNIYRKAGISTIRLYAQGLNLLTFSKFKLWDPELDTNTGRAYPQMRVVNLGLNIIF